MPVHTFTAPPGAPALPPWARAVLATLTALGLLTAGLAAVPREADAATHTIVLANLSFTPATLTVAPGDSVTFVNRETDNTLHTIAGAWSSPELRPGQSFTVTVGSAGTYDFHCSNHPYMTGTVTAGSGGSTPTATPTPSRTAPASAQPTPGPTSTATAVPTATGLPGTTPAPSPTGGVPPYGADQGDGTKRAVYETDGDTKVFRLRMSEVDWEVSPGVVKKAYAFNGIVPGPSIVLNEGDKARFIVTNALPEHTAVHWHGMVLPNSQDGVPGVTQPHIEPGETSTYAWTATATGTHWYHAHEGGAQVGKGLYGALLVNPELGGIAADKHYTLMANDGSNGFTLNGKSYPATVPLKARVGEKVHLRLIGTGPEQLHPMHLHGTPFEVVAQDGMRLSSPYKADTLTVAPGQTFDVVLTAPSAGTWMLHCHVFSHSDGPHGMSGLVTTLEVTP